MLVDGKVIALDAKLNFDDSAMFRHPDIEKLRDTTEQDPKETEAKEWDLAYIALDGNIACLVNGAGLAMSTMDIIKHYGGNPANFLDVGGGASKDKVVAAFKIILGDSNVTGGNGGLDPSWSIYLGSSIDAAWDKTIHNRRGNLVLADGSTPPDWVAMDLFSQAEHDELAQSILLCPDAAYIDAVQAAIERLLNNL